MRNCIVVLVLAAAAAWTLGRPDEVPFRKHTVDLGANETCAFADVNRDGKLDIVSGENWYAGPAWTKHKFRTLNFQNNYIDNFSDLPVDVNGDGSVDIVSCSYFSKRLAWFQNPGRGTGEWKEHPIETGFSVEFTFLVDLDNDGRKQELLPQFGQTAAPLSWYELQKGAWIRHVVSPKSYGHGIGAGDVNGDGRTDILTPKGWFEAPPVPRTGDWKYHAEWDAPQALGFLYTLDVNRDGKADVLTSAAHDYGVFWMEQGGGGTWTKRMIDDSWSQPHATTLVDLNGDKQLDLITGKRFMAHNGRDPGEREALGIYWYEMLRAPDRPVEWVKHVVDYATRTGTGMQIPAADLDGDGDLDFAVAGKSGLFVFENQTRKR